MSFKRVPLSLTQTISVQHNDHSFSATKIRQFNTPVISTKKRLSKTVVSSTQKIVSSTHPSVRHKSYF